MSDLETEAADELSDTDAPEGQAVSLRERHTVSLEELRRELTEDPVDADADADADAAGAAVRRVLGRANLSWMDRVKPVDFTRLGVARYERLFKVPNIFGDFPDLSRKLGAADNAALQQVLRGAAAQSVTSSALSTAIKDPKVTGLFDNAAHRAVRGIDWDALAGANRFAVPQFDLNLTKSFDFEALTKASLVGFKMPTVSGLDGIIGRIQGLYDPARFKDLFDRYKPRNLRSGDVDIDAVERIMIEEGIPFCLVPDTATVGLLVEAEDAAGRRQVLRERAEPIFQACERIIGLCVDAGLPEQGALLRQSVRAYQDGHHAAAQALATVVLDQLIAIHKNATNIKSHVEGVTFIETNLNGRDWFFMLPIPVAHTKTHLITDSEAFNRHATVHQSSSQQLTPTNAVHAVMLATSFLGYHQGLW